MRNISRIEREMKVFNEWCGYPEVQAGMKDYHYRRTRYRPPRLISLIPRKTPDEPSEKKRRKDDPGTNAGKGTSWGMTNAKPPGTNQFPGQARGGTYHPNFPWKNPKRNHFHPVLQKFHPDFQPKSNFTKQATAWWKEPHEPHRERLFSKSPGTSPERVSSTS